MNNTMTVTYFASQLPPGNVLCAQFVIVDNLVLENTETFMIDLSTPAQRVLLQPTSALVVIQDNDGEL